MTGYIVRRLLWMLLVLFIVSLITFVMMRSIPGGPFDDERRVAPEIMRNLERRYNLDAPLHEQYIDYITGIAIPRITTGEFRPTTTESYLINIPLPFGDNTALRWMNFGPSYTSRSRSVNDIFAEHLPVSFQLGAAALVVAMSIGIPLGILSGLRRNTAWDFGSMGVAIIGISIPVIVMGPLLQYVLGVNLRLLPTNGWRGIEYVIMPAFALGFAESALLARLTRASLLQVLSEDYIRTARAKGLTERVVVMFHALKNSLIPVATVLGPLAAALLTGTFVTERIFSIPGMGRYFVESIGNRDYLVLMGTILLYTFFLVFANLLVDLVYAWLDPRIRLD